MSGLFQTHTQVHSPLTELAQRQAAERCCLRAELRLYLLVTALSQGVTVLFAQTGAAVTWMTPLCMLPGLALLGIAALCKRITGAPTLTEAFQAGLHPLAAVLWRGYVTLALLWQGEAALTEVVCLFTEGVVMNIAPFGMAAVTVVTALCCCQRKGLPRCVWLLRYPLLVLLALLFFELTWNGHWDYLLPLSGAGNAANRALFLDMTAMGWPLVLFAELPAREKGQRRDTGPLPALLLLCLLLGAVAFSLPTELALTGKNLADAMLLPMVFLTPVNRLLALTGWVLGLLLALAVSLRRSAALAPGKPAREVLFCVALGVALLLPHLWDEQRLRGVLKLVQPYLLLPGAMLILCLLPGAVLCKRRRKP